MLNHLSYGMHICVHIYLYLYICGMYICVYICTHIFGSNSIWELDLSELTFYCYNRRLQSEYFINNKSLFGLWLWKLGSPGEWCLHVLRAPGLCCPMVEGRNAREEDHTGFYNKPTVTVSNPLLGQH